MAQNPRNSQTEDEPIAEFSAGEASTMSARRMSETIVVRQAIGERLGSPLAPGHLIGGIAADLEDLNSDGSYLLGYSYPSLQVDQLIFDNYIFRSRTGHCSGCF